MKNTLGTDENADLNKRVRHLFIPVNPNHVG